MNFKYAILSLLFILCFVIFPVISSAQSNTGSNKLRDFTYDFSISNWTVSYNGMKSTIEQTSENEFLLSSYKTLLDHTKKEVLLFQVAFATILAAHLLLSFFYMFKPNWLTAPVILGVTAIIFISAFAIYNKWYNIYYAFNDLRFYYFSLIS